MATQSTPHNQSQQNASAAEADLEPNQLVQEVGQDVDAELYKNSDGAQTGGTRAFNANASGGNLPKSLDQDAALTGKVNTRTPQSDEQGITNHSASEESARQEKVVSQRPDAQAGVDLVGHKVQQ